MRAASSQTTTRRHSPELVPILLLTAVFGLSRLASFAAGVRFDASTLTWYVQFVDPLLLQTDLLRSVYYLHTQPPLFNLYLGTVLKLFPESYYLAFATTYALLGLALALCLYSLLRQLAGSRWVAATAAAMFIGSAPCLLYENWLFYTYPVTVALCASGYFLHRFSEQGRYRDGLIFFSLLAILVLLRSVFQLFWFAFFVLLLLFYRPVSAKRVLAAAILPFSLILSLYVKNYCVFGAFTTSTWLGPSLAKITTFMLPLNRKRTLVRAHRLSALAFVSPLRPSLDQLYTILPPAPKTGVPVLDQVNRSTGSVNANNLTLIAGWKLYRDDALYVVRAFPRTYLKGISRAYVIFFEPASAYWLLMPNLGMIARWAGFCDVALYGSAVPLLPSLIDPPDPANMGLFIILAYALALAYGGRQLWRSFRRPDSRTARTLTLSYLCLNVVYVMIVCNALDLGENNRFRFPTEPLVVALLAACLTDCLRWWTSRRQRARARAGSPA